MIAGKARSFKGLSRQILMEPDARIQQYRKTLLNILGDNGRLIVDLLPDFGFITGLLPELDTIGLEEAKNRLNHVIASFLATFATPLHPLVLFLDDLQWMDMSSVFMRPLSVIGRLP